MGPRTITRFLRPEGAARENLLLHFAAGFFLYITLPSQLPFDRRGLAWTLY